MTASSGDADADVARISLRERVESQIREAILDGSFEPGELLNVAELQNWLGVSRTPIREALNNLSRVGFVETAAQRYTRVAAPRPEERVCALQTIGALLSGIVRVTVPTMTSTQLGDAIMAIDPIMDAVSRRDIALHYQLARRLVHLFVGLCPNPIMTRLALDSIDVLGYQITVTQSQSTTAWPNLESGYPALAAALQDRDAVRAALALEEIFRLVEPSR